MNEIKETAPESRQGEISPKKNVFKVLAISTVVATIVLLLAAYFQIWT